MLKAAMGVVAVAIATATAAADEGTSELTTGGLVFARNENIEVVSEDLAISPNEVSIRYRVLNKSDRDVTVLVTFAMPEIHIESSDNSPSLPTDQPVNLLAAASAVDGNPASAAVEQRVIAAGLDRTQLLRDLGIPLAPHLPGTHEKLDRLPPQEWEHLQRLGLADIEQYDSGAGVKKHLGPRWQLQTTLFWEQTFAPKTETLIEHRYQPSLGSSGYTGLGSPAEAKEPWYEEYTEKYCLGHEFLAAVERARKLANTGVGSPFSEQRISYAHKTWVTGSGSPIKQFRLAIDKGSADNLVSFCGEEARKISATQIEISRADYAPDGTLEILFLKKLP